MATPLKATEKKPNPAAVSPERPPVSPDPMQDDLDDTLDALLSGSNVDLDEVRKLAATRAGNVGQGAVWSLLQGILDGAANLQPEELDTYLAELPAAITDRWGNPDADRIGAIVDMTTQGAIGAAADAALSDPESIEGMPYRAFLAVLDSSTTMLCSACGEPPTVLPAGHPWFQTHSPPLHFSCRSWLCGLTAEQAGQLGIRGGPDVDADEGFGSPNFYWGVAPVDTDYEDLMPGEGEAASALSDFGGVSATGSADGNQYETMQPDADAAIAAEAKLGTVERLYSPDQPRQADGKFGEGGAEVPQHEPKYDRGREGRSREWIAADDARMARTQYVVNTLPSKEQAAVENWVGLHSSAMRALDAGKSYEATTAIVQRERGQFGAEHVKSIVDGAVESLPHFKAALEKLPMTKPETVFRGLHVDDARLAQLTAGKTLTLPAMSSATTSASIGEGFATREQREGHNVLLVLDGARGRDLSHMGEGEVLLPKGASFQVHDVYKHVEENGPNATHPTTTTYVVHARQVTP